MGRDTRKALIAELEELRGTRVLTYITGDRAPATAQIGDDAVRPMYDHLRQMGRVENLDLFVYSRGGAIDVPWRIVTALRQASDRWSILVPFRANSAATLLALGADHIVMGPQGELGPIDPILGIQRMTPQGPVQDNISVEDVMAYLKFVRERAGLSDQEALALGLSKLTDRMDAVVLGNVHRTHSHIRDVARRMLSSRSQPASEQEMTTIIDTLAERVYAHGHAIGLSDAEKVGLPAKAASADEDRIMWTLLTEYESDLKLLQPLDPASATATTDVFREDAVIAVIQSTWASHELTGVIEIKAQRQMPQNLNVGLNLNLQLPQGVDVQQLPQAVQAAFQAAMQEVQQAMIQQAQQAVQDALRAQAPVTGYEAGFRNGRWEQIATSADGSASSDGK